MAARRTTTASAAPPPPAPQLAQLGRLAALLALLGAVLAPDLLPRLPSPSAGVDWRATLAPALPLLSTPLPPAPVPLPFGWTLAPQPALQWCWWGLAAFLAVLALSLLQHLGLLAAQRTRPRGQARTYLRFLVPADPPGAPADGATLWRTLHGMLPPTDPRRPGAPPLIACLTARPECKVQLGLSLCGPPTLISGMQRQLISHRVGTRVEPLADPFWGAAQAGHWLCAAPVQLRAPAALPIAVIGRTLPLQRALLSALAPQAGVLAVRVGIAAAPVASPRWRLRVLAAQAARAADAGTEERQAFNAKTSGPAYTTAIWVLALARTPAAGVAQVQTVGAALAASAQTIGANQQALVLGPVQVVPAVVPPPSPLPRSGWLRGLLLGLALAAATAWWQPESHCALPLLVGLLGPLLCAAAWRHRTGAALADRHAQLAASPLPLQNPQVVPIWAAWLGRNGD